MGYLTPLLGSVERELLMVDVRGGGLPGTGRAGRGSANPAGVLALQLLASPEAEQDPKWGQGDP